MGFDYKTWSEDGIRAASHTVLRRKNTSVRIKPYRTRYEVEQKAGSDIVNKLGPNSLNPTAVFVATQVGHTFTISRRNSDATKPLIYYTVTKCDDDYRLGWGRYSVTENFPVPTRAEWDQEAVEAFDVGIFLHELYGDWKKGQDLEKWDLGDNEWDCSEMEKLEDWELLSEDGESSPVNRGPRVMSTVDSWG